MIVNQQGGADGPIVTLSNAYNAAIDLAKALGRRQPNRYFTNPATGQLANGVGASGASAANVPSPTAPAINPLAIAASQAQAAQTNAALTVRDQNIKAELALNKARSDAALKKYAIDQQTRAEIVTSAIRAGHER